MPAQWVLKEQGDRNLVESLSKQLNINPILATLLVQRGIRSYEEAKTFFRPELSMLHDPFLMKDMDIAIGRIERAIAAGEKIMVYGDYDVDGTTAVSLVYLFFKKIYPHIDFYIPDRYSEGYGVSFRGIDHAYENGFTLIIALDCGIKANDKIDYAREKGIEFIICDHHLPGAALPQATAVLDPKRDDCPYPNKELPGCGIGFKLVQAYCLKNNIPFAEIEGYLDLVAIAIGADIVPITGENRVLVFYGLKKINEQRRQGIKAIIEISGLKKELNVTDVVFVIGPRINAAGRIESGRQAVELLISNCPDNAALKSTGINEHNLTRKDLDKTITEQALELIARDELFVNRKSAVLYHPEWHKGIIGIVASRIADKFCRPTIILTRSDGKVAGSARSVKGFDVYNAIERCSDLLEQFGGHTFAAGLTMKPEAVDEFRSRFEEAVNETIDEKCLIPSIEIDSELNFSDITEKFFNVLKQFEPFGPGNLSPIFQSGGVKERGYAKVVGKNHLKVSLYQNNRNRLLHGIAFGMGEIFQQINPQKEMEVCYHVEETFFMDKKSLQLNIKDIRI